MARIHTKVYRHSAGAASDDAEAISKSGAGINSKIHLAADAWARCLIVRERCGADLLSDEPLVTDKDYGGDIVRKQISAQKRRSVKP
tara:strand:- start:2471 stop:2731 length:261 start_codon:yes stop_codon:yes gene_type:complete